MFKRTFAGTNQALANNFKAKANGAGLALERKLLHLSRKSYNDSTPAKIWKRLLCCQSTDVLANKVYSNPVAWIQDGEKGTLINFFIVLWLLLLSGYVDGLEQDRKEEWHSIFHGSAAQDMANMVLR